MNIETRDGKEYVVMEKEKFMELTAFLQSHRYRKGNMDTVFEMAKQGVLSSEALRVCQTVGTTSDLG